MIRTSFNLLTGHMEKDNRKKLVKLVLPLIVVILGIVLLVFNIVIEDEPGALPLAVTIVGGAWLLIQRQMNRRQRVHNPTE